MTVSQSPEVVRGHPRARRRLGAGAVPDDRRRSPAPIGYAVSRALSAPFQQLAVAAAALGRGRFDLDLPRHPDPRGQGDRPGAGAPAPAQLEDRLRRERDFAEHASHVLRTPLTGLRLELEELSLRDDVPEDVRAAAARGLGGRRRDERRGRRAGRSSRAAAPWSRGPSCRWSTWPPSWPSAGPTGWPPGTARCAASAEGDLTLTYTPGPVEHVLDLVLADVVRRGSGPSASSSRARTAGTCGCKVSSAAARPCGARGRRHRAAGLGPGPRRRWRRSAAGSSGRTPPAASRCCCPRR